MSDPDRTSIFGEKYNDHPLGCELRSADDGVDVAFWWHKVPGCDLPHPHPDDEETKLAEAKRVR